MNEFKTLFFLGITIFIAWKLWSVLGETTGHEKPPIPPFNKKNNQGVKDNVYELRKEKDTSGIYDSPPNRWAPHATAGSPQEAGFNKIAAIERDFNAEHFQNGAKTAYEMIVQAFAKGDKDILKKFLSDDVYNNFVSVIEEREQRQESVETTFVSIEKADFQDVKVEGKRAFITIAFSSKLISYTKNSQGHIVEGDPGLVVDITDHWTFSRVLGNKNPNWLLVATGIYDIQ